MRTKLFIGSSPQSTRVRGLDWLSQTRDSVPVAGLSYRPEGKDKIQVLGGGSHPLEGVGYGVIKVTKA